MKLHILHPTRSRKSDSPNFASVPAPFDPEYTAFLKEFGRVHLRPIRPEDEGRMIAFHEGLSEENAFLRYFEPMPLTLRTVHERLAQVCANTADSYAIVAEVHTTASRPARILGVGRLTTTESPRQAGFALVVRDDVRDTELPQEILKRLMSVARACRFRSLEGEVLMADQMMLGLCRRLGFKLQVVPEDALVRVRHFL